MFMRVMGKPLIPWMLLNFIKTFEPLLPIQQRTKSRQRKISLGEFRIFIVVYSNTDCYYVCYYNHFVCIYTFFSIRVFFHRHWRFTGQQGKREDHLSFLSTTPTRSRTLRHLFENLHVRRLSRIFNRNACV